MLKIVFAGTPDIAVPSLEKISENHSVIAVLTNPPARDRRGGELIASPVETAARRISLRESRLKVFTPSRIDEEFIRRISALSPDVLVCFAYGRIFPEKFLKIFPLGGINMHPSLLPRWRGCSPIPSAILNKDPLTGFTVQRLAKEMDSGDIILQKTYALAGNETTGFLTGVAANEGARMLEEALNLIENGAAVYTPQNDGEATYCAKISNETRKIDWAQRTEDVDAHIRAYAPQPGAFTEARRICAGKDEKRLLLILEAVPAPQSAAARCAAADPGTVVFADKDLGIIVKTADGAIAVKRLQWQSKKALEWKDFMNGSRDFLGTLLGA